MNWNAIRTYLAGSGILILLGPYAINLVLTMFGCSGDLPNTPEVEVAQCTGGELFSIPAGFQAILGGVIFSVVFWLKARLGTGTAAQNLTLPAAPIVPKKDAAVGVVTMEQVNTVK